MLRIALAIMLTGAAALAPMTARADAYGDLLASMKAFAAATSWHAVEQMPGGHVVTVDYVAPDKWRIAPTPTMTELLIGNDVYMVRNGKSTHLPIPGSMLRATISRFDAQVPSDVKASAKDLGMQNVGGQMVHAYQFTSKGTPVVMYIGSNRLPVQSVVKDPKGNVTITYSQYNAPITISP
jgi:hypothetical protein